MGGARKTGAEKFLRSPPVIWLGQSVDSSVLAARYPSMRAWPLITSIGDAMRRERYLGSHFHAGLRDVLGVSGPVMVDSGGFVLMKQELPGWTVSRVAKIYHRLNVDVLVSLDHPPMRHETMRRRRAKRQRTLRNLEVMANEFDAEKLMPVVHGITLEEVEKCCLGVKEIVRRPRWIGAGGLVPLLRQLGFAGRHSSVGMQQHLGEVIAIVRRHFPDSLVHIFGAGSPRSCLAAFAMGADSADSQGWRQAAGFGSIYLPGRGQRILEWSRPGKQPRPIVDAGDLELLSVCRCPVCRRSPDIGQRIAVLKQNFEPRAVHNAWVLQDEVRLFRRARSERAVRSLLESRLPKALFDVTVHMRDARS